jgi:type I restriction enzyme M protein
LTNKADKKYISKSLSCDRCEINISQEIGFRDDTEDLSLDALTKELDDLMKSMCEDYQKNGLWGF